MQTLHYRISTNREGRAVVTVDSPLGDGAVFLPAQLRDVAVQLLRAADVAEGRAAGEGAAPASRPLLADADHQLLGSFLAHVLQAFRAGQADLAHAAATLAHLIAAVDEGNLGEMRAWLNRDRDALIKHLEA